MSLSVSAPGRICLFGEHQDYLGLPVIPCAISLRIRFQGDWNNSGKISVALPDVNSSVEFLLSSTEIHYTDKSKADNFRSAYNLLLRQGFTFNRGISCTVRGEIPLNAGTSSSSAMVVGWVHFLALMSDQQTRLDSLETASLAYHAEVSEFGEHGGMMDQYSSAKGGVIHLRTVPDMLCTRLSMNPGEIILADSGQPKNTQGMLKNVRIRAETVLNEFETVDIHNSPASVAKNNVLLGGILRNRDITCEALDVSGDATKLGELLTEEHSILRDVLGTSTKKIDRMVETALDAGALGAKINGSGGGGCMFATVHPDSVENVMEALQKNSARVWRVKADKGVTIDD